MDSNWTKAGVLAGVAVAVVTVWGALRSDPHPSAQTPTPPEAAVEVSGTLQSVPPDPRLGEELLRIPKRQDAHIAATMLYEGALWVEQSRSRRVRTEADDKEDEERQKALDATKADRQLDWFSSRAKAYADGRAARLARVTVRNVGTVTVREFHVVLPNVAYVVHVRRGAAEALLADQVDMAFGDLQPSEELVLSAWDERDYSTSEDIAYRHADGAGTVSITTVDRALAESTEEVARLQSELTGTGLSRWWGWDFATFVGVIVILAAGVYATGTAARVE